MLGVGRTVGGLMLGGAAVAGLTQGVGTSIREGMMEAAFGDPNADAAFLGRNVSARFLMGSAIGGPIGGALQMSAPSDQFMVNPMRPTLGTTVAGGVVGAGIGGVIGGMAGVRGAIAGGVLGAIGGAAVAPAAYTAGHIRRNQNFYGNSPYNISTRMAEQLNASGDIVLGMHNMRGGM